MNKKNIRLGGTFAPPLTDDLLVRYQQLYEALPRDSQIRDAMAQLHTCCKLWWELPESGHPGVPHPVGPMEGLDGKRYKAPLVISLEDDHMEQLWESIPWKTDLDAMGVLFDSLNPVTQKQLRDAAYHLLWHAKELEKDREPITKDKLEKA